jgi:imidazolonepropionase-like amidohydrolase
MKAPWALAATAAILLAGLAACATDGATGPAVAQTANAAPPPKSEAKPLPPGLDPWADKDPFPSTYRPLPSRPTAIVGANVLTATGVEIDNGVVVMVDGKIAAVGPAGTATPAGADIIDGKGMWVTPGVIDGHSHLGVYPSPEVPALSDGNELTDPNTAGVWAEHSVWPEDPGFDRARAGGVTSLQILPGSGNLFGGRSVLLKNVPATTAMGMKFPGAPYGLKMACGENPKRVYGSKGRAPSTEMGNVAGYRRAWIDAADYKRRWDDYRARIGRGERADPPKRDLTNDTLMGVLNGEIRIQNHCYRAHEMAMMIDISHEFGFHIAAFHHTSEGYKIAPLLAKEGICMLTWADWAGFKMESIDGIEANAALAHRAGACVIIHSDDPIITQHLNQEAGIAMAAGNHIGLNITPAEAIAWITLNPAKAAGVADRTGSLEPGKMADVVLWNAMPFSIYAKAEKVFIDGGLAYDRHDKRYQPKSDFELGQPGEGAFQ